MDGQTVFNLKERYKLYSLLDLTGDPWGLPVRKRFESLQSCSNIKIIVLQIL